MNGLRRRKIWGFKQVMRRPNRDCECPAFVKIPFVIYHSLSTFASLSAFKRFWQIKLKRKMSWIDSDIPHKQCCECFQWCGTDYYAKQYEGRYGVASRCKGCTKEMIALLKVLKAANPKPPEGTPCQRCGRQPTTKGTRGRGLHCDHDHETNAFIAWICNSCNNKGRRPFVRYCKWKRNLI